MGLGAGERGVSERARRGVGRVRGAATSFVPRADCRRAAVLTPPRDRLSPVSLMGTDSGSALLSMSLAFAELKDEAPDHLTSRTSRGVGRGRARERSEVSRLFLTPLPLPTLPTSFLVPLCIFYNYLHCTQVTFTVREETRFLPDWLGTFHVLTSRPVGSDLHFTLRGWRGVPTLHRVPLPPTPASAFSLFFPIRSPSNFLLSFT